MKTDKRLAKSRSSSISLARSEGKGKPVSARALVAPTSATCRRPGRSKLARDGDPYVMADGKVIQPENMFPDPAKDAALAKSSKAYRPLRKRSIQDLPAMPNVMKGIALVFTLTILGVSDREIGELLGVTSSQVRSVRNHVGYGETFEIGAAEFVSAKSQRLVSRIAAMADDAIEQVHNISVNGHKEANVLKASIDILDRAGVKAKDTEAHRQQQNELRITIIKGGNDADVEVNGIAIDP